MPYAKTVTIPSVELTFDQLVAAIRQLEPEARSDLVRVLAETELDVRMAELISSLAQRKPADDVSDADVQAEIQTIRGQKRDRC